MSFSAFDFADTITTAVLPGSLKRLPSPSEDILPHRKRVPPSFPTPSPHPPANLSPKTAVHLAPANPPSTKTGGQATKGKARPATIFNLDDLPDKIRNPHIRVVIPVRNISTEQLGSTGNLLTALYSCTYNYIFILQKIDDILCKQRRTYTLPPIKPRPHWLRRLQASKALSLEPNQERNLSSPLTPAPVTNVVLPKKKKSGIINQVHRCHQIPLLQSPPSGTKNMAQSCQCSSSHPGTRTPVSLAFPITTTHCYRPAHLGQRRKVE